MEKVESKYTTIRISKELRKRLVELKLNLNVRTYEDVIVYLLSSGSSRPAVEDPVLNFVVGALQDFCKKQPDAGFHPRTIVKLFEDRLSTHVKEFLISRPEVKCSELDRFVNELIKYVRIMKYVEQAQK